jgi:hypothetical protein
MAVLRNDVYDLFPRIKESCVQGVFPDFERFPELRVAPDIGVFPRKGIMALIGYLMVKERTSRNKGYAIMPAGSFFLA